MEKARAQELLGLVDVGGDYADKAMADIENADLDLWEVIAIAYDIFDKNAARALAHKMHEAYFAQAKP